MAYAVVLTKKAERQIKKLPPGIRSHLAACLSAIASDPRPQGCKKLTDSPYYRVRTGDIRIVYDIDDAQSRVAILLVADRKDVYKKT